MLAPGEINTKHVINQVICMATAFAICAAVDRGVCRRFKKPYFALHVFVNAIIVALVMPGAMRALMAPSTSSVIPPGVQGPNALYMAWIYALHVYHPIFFKTGLMDWIHHVPVYILNTLCFSIPSSDAVLLQALIMVGIPGGLDYLLQVFEGEGRLSRGRYKELCSEINIWCRAPLGAIGSYVCLVGLYHGWGDATAYQRFVLILLGVHAGWNPPFFCRQAVEANIIDTINRYGLSGASGREGLKLPKVRSLCGTEGKAAAKPNAAAAAAAAPPSVRVREEAYPVNMSMSMAGGKHADVPMVMPSPSSVTEQKKAL
jgi:hypothetical protein